MEIQWYPGHMAKTKRMMEENIRLVDVVVEVVDARIPYSSKNPYLNRLWQRRPRVMALNKADLADDTVNQVWKKWYEEQGYGVVLVDSLHGKGYKEIAKEALRLCSAKREKDAARGLQNRPIRMMVTGIPNVGKSTLINRLVGRAEAAKTGNKPGVTKGKQWIKVGNGLELLDTPGILWPKFEDPQVGQKIAFIGSIKDDILDSYTLAVFLLNCLSGRYPDALSKRYGIEEAVNTEGDVLLEMIGRKRGHLRSGGVVDVERTAAMLLDEFRSGKLGRLSLETPDEIQESRV